MRSLTFPDLPDGWEWWSGSGGDGYYTRWFGTEEREYEGEVYWDDPGQHHVQIYPIIGELPGGDPDVSEYPDKSDSFDTAQDALDAVPELIEEFEDG